LTSEIIMFIMQTLDDFSIMTHDYNNSVNIRENIISLKMDELNNQEK
jgi:hypothetical protein